MWCVVMCVWASAWCLRVGGRLTLGDTSRVRRRFAVCATPLCVVHSAKCRVCREVSPIWQGLLARGLANALPGHPSHRPDSETENTENTENTESAVRDGRWCGAGRECGSRQFPASGAFIYPGS